MKKMIFLPIALLSLASCTGNFEDYNKRDQYGLTPEELTRIPAGAQNLKALATWIMPDQENGWQMDMDLAGAYSGYNGTTHPAFMNDYNAYTPRYGWEQYPYRDTYGNHLYADFNAIKALDPDNLDRPEYALASIMRVAITQRLTDMYGALPYSKVNGIDLNIPYDSQRDLYETMCSDLQRAAGILEALPQDFTKYKVFDPIYQGDMKAWARYARSLVLRMAVHMRAVNTAKARELAEWAVSNGVIETNAQNAVKASIDNPAYKVAVSWGDSGVGADIVSYLKAFQDPRLEKMVAPAPGRVGDQYFGLPMGNTVGAKSDQGATMFSKPNITKTSPIYILTAAEVAFLKAEGALFGWNMGGEDAEALYKKGVALSMEQWGITDSSVVDTYLAVTDTRGAYIDPQYPQLNNANFSSAITVSWASAGGDQEKQLARIITQKWIAGFPYQTIEAWTEWRRTGYPNFTPSLTNNSAGEVEDIHQDAQGRDRGGMRRNRYSQDEKLQNGANINNALQEIGGVDSRGADLWWAR